MTTALYRRYRPDTFQDVIGQDHVTAPLMAALRADKVTHAYLFSGPRGCGKTTSARILARCLNCEQYPTDTPCGECPSCRDLATGGPGSLDVVEIDAASHNGVDDARDLRERASFAPARDRFKIFILDEAHMVTPQGFNALLKLVEEPPAHVKFIFATTEPEKVIGTIRSRTHHYPFRLVPPDVLEGYLGHLCEAEGVEVGAGVFPLVTRAGGGSVRDTLSVMDQLIGGAVDGEVDYQRAVALLGYTDTTMLDQCVDAIAAADGAGVFRVVDRVVASGHDPRRFVEDLLQRLRDLLVIALAGSEAGPALGSLPEDELARMEVQARTIGAAGLSRAADMTAQALSQMVGATSPRLQLELLMARLLIPSQRAAGAAGAAPAAAPAVQGPTAPAAGGQGAPVPGGALAGGPAPAAGQGGGRARAAEIARRAGGQDDAVAQGEPVKSGAEPQAQHVAVDWDAPARPGGAPAQASVSPSEVPSTARSESAARPSNAAPGRDRGAPAQTDAPAASSSGSAAAGSGADGPSGDSAADAEMIRTRWEEVLDAAKRSRRATWALVGPNSQPGSIQGGVFQVLFTARGLVGAFENGGHGPILAAAIHQALGLDLEVHAVLAGGDGGGPAGGGPASGQGGNGGPRNGSGQRGGGSGACGQGGRSGSSGQRGVPAWDEAPAWDAPADASAPAPRGSSGSDASARAAAPAGPVGDDGWGEVAVPGGARAEAAAAAVPEAAAQASQQAADVAPEETTNPVNEPEPARPSEVDEASDGATTGTGGQAPARADADSDDAGPTPAQEAAAASRASEEKGDHADEDQQTEDPALASAHAAAQRSDEAHEAEDAEVVDTAERPEEDPASANEATPVDGEQPGGSEGDPATDPTASQHTGGGAPESSPTSPGAREGRPDASSAPPEDDAGDAPDEPPLATVHRLRALPEIPGGAASSSEAGRSGNGRRSADGAEANRASGSGPGGAKPRHGLAPVSWDAPAADSGPAQWQSGPQTFSDGVPLPEEPGDPDGPGDAWAPSGEASGRVSAAIAAARAAARGDAPRRGAVQGRPGSTASIDDDVVSEDDEDAEEAGVVGLEVVKRLLGATVLEDVTVNQEGL